MEDIESVENELLMKADYNNITQQPNVILKDGFQTNELKSGVDFEVKEKYREDDEDNNQQAFFDSEEMFQLLNYECVDGSSATNAITDEDKSPFTIMKENMTAITNDKGVYKMVVKKGTGDIVKFGAICRIHYNGYLEFGGEPFDSTRLRNRLQQIQLGRCFLGGFDVAIGTMRKGEISKFIFSPQYAYREMGCPPRIPPNTSVLFEIELVSFVDQTASDEFSEFPKEEINKASFENIHEVAQSFRETGNDLFRQNEFYRAIKKYDKGIQLLETCRVQNVVEEKKMNNALLLLYMNASLCSLKLGQGARAKRYGRKALDIDPRNVKAVFRIAQGFKKEGDFGKAREWYLRAQRQEPNNADIKIALQKLEQDVQRWRLSEKQMCKRMFPETKLKSTVSTKENTPPESEEKPATGVSEEVKSLMMKRLQDFQTDDKQSEIVFPSSLTTNEVNFLVGEAKKNGLFCITPSKKISYLKIMKEKGE